MLAVISNQYLTKNNIRRKAGNCKTAHSSPPDYETRNIVSASDGVSCAENDETRKKDMVQAWQEYDKMAETQIGFNYRYEFKMAYSQYKCGDYQEASYGFLKIHKKLEPKVQQKLANLIEILYWHRSLKLLKEMPKERQKCEEVKEIVLKSESEVAWSDFKESLFVQRFFDKEERQEFAGYFKRVLRGA